MASSDDFIIEVRSKVARRMTDTRLPGAQLRESRHLDPFTKDAIGEAVGIRPMSKRFDSPLFVGLGGVDVVPTRPQLFMELKWSYERPGKIFESV